MNKFTNDANFIVPKSKDRLNSVKTSGTICTDKNQDINHNIFVNISRFLWDMSFKVM